MTFSILKKTRAAAETIFIAGFLFAMATPFLWSLLRADAGKAADMRAAVRAGISAGHPVSAAGAYKRYFENNFGFRNKLVTLNAAVKLKLLGVSSSPDVIAGRGGWLFYAGEGAADYARALHPMTQPELESWRLDLERKRNYLASRGILYLFVICPDKESIYPEDYPAAMNRVRAGTNLDQLLQYFAANSNFRIIDLRPALGRAKERGPVFYKTDTHWTPLGAHAGYTEIMSGVGGYYVGVRSAPLNEYRTVSSTRKGGDLAGLLGLQSVLWEPDSTLAPLRPDGVAVERQFKYKGDDVTVYRCDSAPLGAAVIFHDSFMNAMMPFISRHFRRTYYIHSAKFYPEIVDSVRPAMVMEEMVERLLQ